MASTLQFRNQNLATDWICTILGPTDDLTSLEQKWRSLYDSLATPPVFASWEWAASWWTHLGAVKRTASPANRYYIVLVEDEHGNLNAIVPFHSPIQSSISTYPHGLRPWGVIGQRYQDLTEEPILLMREGCEESILRAVLSFLLDASDSYKWDFIQLHFASTTTDIFERSLNTPTGLNGYSNGNQAVNPKLQRSWLGQDLVKHEGYGMYKLVLPETWSEYKSQLSQSSRESLNRKPKLLERQCKNWTIESTNDPAETEHASNLMVRLHRERASISEIRICHVPSKEDRLFLLDAHLKMAKRGMVSFHTLVADGKPIASQCIYHIGNQMLFYYCGFDLKWQKVSPMIILHAEIIKKAIADGVSEILLHRYNQEWKLRLGAKEYSRFQKLLIIRPSLETFLRIGLYSLNKNPMDEIEPF